MQLGQGTGPLKGVKVVELAGIGPGPHACTLLADLGADVIRVDRPGGGTLGSGAWDLLMRGRPNVALDLKRPEGIETVLRLVESADVIIEGLRPGAVERLGLGPDDVLARNPRIVYGRMTGWGQDGPLALSAGHDLTYLATSGQLHLLGQDKERPQFPMNLLADFGAGSTYLVIGVLSALLEARLSGHGQVVDAAIVDGLQHLGLLHAGFIAGGIGSETRGANLLDGGTPFYDLYRTSDDRWVAVAPIEPQFFDTMITLAGIKEECPGQYDFDRYADMRALFERTFAQRTMAEWGELFEGTDGCVAPVLTPTEAAAHPHNVARGNTVEKDGVRQSAPAPRFSRTAATLTTSPAPRPGVDTTEALTAWGIDDVEELVAAGVAVQA